jgi:hypothetical protein
MGNTDHVGTQWGMPSGYLMGTLTISMAIYTMAMLNNQMVCFIFWGLSIHQTFHNAKKRGFDQQKW